MTDFNWCHGPKCHTYHTVDRVRGVKGSKVLRTRKIKLNRWNEDTYWKYFCSQGCKNEWLNVNMESIARRTLPPFIEHRRITEGYHKTKDRWNRSTVEKIGVDNNAD